MADTARRLIGPTALTTTATTYYTAPASTTTILRNIHIANVTSGSVTFNLGVGPASVATNCLYYQMTVPGYGSIDWSGFLVLAATETISAMANAGSSITLTVSGVEVA